MITFLVSGDEPVLRERLLKLLLSQAKVTPQVVSQNEIPTVIGGNPFVDMDEVILCLDVNDKLDVKHLQGGDQVTLILQYQGRLKETSRLGAWGKANRSYHRQVNRPEKPWELKDYVTSFLVEEFKAAGKSCSSDLAEALASRLGSDLGHLRFEVMKVVIAMGNDTQVGVPHLKGILAPMGEANVQMLIDAISDQDLARTVRAFLAIQESHSSDPTLKVTRFLTTNAVKWLQVLLLVQQQGKEGAISTLGANAWFVENKLLPPARRWGEQKLKAIISACAKAEACLFEGRRSSWDLLVSSLVSLYR